MDTMAKSYETCKIECKYCNCFLECRILKFYVKESLTSNGSSANSMTIIKERLLTLKY